MTRPYGGLLVLALVLAVPACSSSTSSTSSTPTSPSTATSAPAAPATASEPPAEPSAPGARRFPTVAQVAEVYPHLADAEARVRSTRIRRLTDDCRAGRPRAGVQARRASYLMGPPAGLVAGPAVEIEALTFRSVAAASDFVRTHVGGFAACSEHEPTMVDKSLSTVEPVRFAVGEQRRGFTTRSQMATNETVDHLLAARDGRRVVLVSVTHPMPNNPVESAVQVTRLALEAATS